MGLLNTLFAIDTTKPWRSMYFDRSGDTREILLTFYRRGNNFILRRIGDPVILCCHISTGASYRCFLLILSAGGRWCAYLFRDGRRCEPRDYRRKRRRGTPVTLH
jgi:hypothetical protein